jgi:hypothetical protein
VVGGEGVTRFAMRMLSAAAAMSWLKLGAEWVRVEAGVAAQELVVEVWK